jgi:hypothetical protein
MSDIRKDVNFMTSEQVSHGMYACMYVSSRPSIEHKATLMVSWSALGHTVGPFGRGLGPSQGLYLHRRTQYTKTKSNIHAVIGAWTRDPVDERSRPLDRGRHICACWRAGNITHTYDRYLSVRCRLSRGEILLNISAELLSELTTRADDTRVKACRTEHTSHAQVISSSVQVSSLHLLLQPFG